MNKLQFDTLPEAKEFVVFTKSKGYTVSEPTKVKRPKSARKVYDLNGKTVAHRYQVIMGARGVGKRGGKKSDNGSTKEETAADFDRMVKEMKEARREEKDFSKRETGESGSTKEETAADFDRRANEMKEARRRKEVEGG